LCQGCCEPFSQEEVDCPASLENNQLVQCQQCSCWWHQACHAPALYPLPVEFCCKDCPSPSNQPAEPQSEPRDHASCQPTAARQPRRRTPQPPAPAPAPAERARRTNTVDTSHCPTSTNELQVGTRLNIYWEHESRSFAGTIMQIDHENEMHEILYVDGDRDWEDLEAMEYTVLSQPSYKDTSRSNETRNSRLNWV
jgi:hypothetical protein